MTVPPPVAKYRLTLVIDGNSHDEIEDELLSMTRGGYLLCSNYYERDEFRVIGGRRTATLEHTNPAQTPERYVNELREWVDKRRAERGAISDTLALYLLTAFTFVLCAAVIVLGEGWL